MGLLFSSPSLPQTPSSVSTAADRKEEGRGGGGEREERKSTFTSPPPSRPPALALLQSRTAPPLPPAPLRRTSSRKSTDPEVGEGTGREKGQNPAKTTEKEEGVEGREEKTGNKSGLLGEVVEQENSSRHPEEEEEVKRDREKKEKEDEKEEKEVTMDKEEDKQTSGSQCVSLPAKPSRPVPPPRRKPADTPVCPSQAAGGLANQSAKRAPPPSPVRRPDVSLYSPQGGVALGTDPDSCSASSTEEEGELIQEQEQNHRWVWTGCSLSPTPLIYYR